MFCPHCGAKSPYGLKYCKRCGGNLSESAESRSPNITASIWAVALACIAITLGGLGIVISSAYELVRPLYPGEVRTGDASMVAGMILLFGTLTVFGVAGLLVRFASRLLGGEPSNEPSIPGKQIQSAPAAAQIAAPPQAIGSVVEHTTRNFDIEDDRIHMRDPGGRMTR
ncbi:MAG TPA: zinc ribbon domain-containing protein [Blastocatellia bacterium]